MFNIKKITSFLTFFLSLIIASVPLESRHASSALLSAMASAAALSLNDSMPIPYLVRAARVLTLDLTFTIVGVPAASTSLNAVAHRSPLSPASSRVRSLQ